MQFGLFSNVYTYNMLQESGDPFSTNTGELPFRVSGSNAFLDSNSFFGMCDFSKPRTDLFKNVFGRVFLPASSTTAAVDINDNHQISVETGLSEVSPWKMTLFKFKLSPFSSSPILCRSWGNSLTTAFWFATSCPS